MARTPNLQLHAMWRQRFRRQVDSGLTIAQFCDQEGLSTATFHSWKRRLRVIELADTLPATSAPLTFLPVTVRLAERGHADVSVSPIVADLPNGIRLHIPTTDARLACRLVRTVARAKTHSGDPR